MLNGLVTVHPLVLAKANSTVNRVTELDDDWMCTLLSEDSLGDLD